MANFNEFGADTTQDVEPYAPVPAGKYLAVITSSENTVTKAETGMYLKLVFQIIEGPHKGTSVFARLNLKNPNETAVRIARAELTSIRRATGVATPKDSVELHNIPIAITLATEISSSDGVTRNVIRKYESAAVLRSTPQQQATANSGGEFDGTTPPWRRNN